MERIGRSMDQMKGKHGKEIEWIYTFFQTHLRNYYGHVMVRKTPIEALQRMNVTLDDLGNEPRGSQSSGPIGTSLKAPRGNGLATTNDEF
jgi:hypothetical protein